jgi:tetratricopeptide (TPR) repeat protein
MCRAVADSIVPKRNVALFRVFAFGIFFVAFLLTSVLPACSESKSIARQEIPAELRASDPEIRTLIESAIDKADAEDFEGALQLATKAWDLCKAKGLESDLPIAGLELSALSISKGEIDQARELLNRSLEAAADRSNVVLEAEILLNLALIREASGDRKGALILRQRSRVAPTLPAVLLY